jgi:hypothetical protein
MLEVRTSVGAACAVSFNHDVRSRALNPPRKTARRPSARARREKVLLMVSTAPSTLETIGGRKPALLQIVLSYWVRMSKE